MLLPQVMLSHSDGLKGKEIVPSFSFCCQGVFYLCSRVVNNAGTSLGLWRRRMAYTLLLETIAKSNFIWEDKFL